MKPRIYTHFINDILKAIEAIERFIAQMELSDFQNDEKTIRAIERELEIIGEAVKKLPEELTQNYQEIPWKLIARMRDRLIHHCWETEVEILWKTVKESLPPLKESIIKMIALEQNTRQQIVTGKDTTENDTRLDK